ncbi:MAG: nucleotide-binding protein [Saprospiraceae bacterium]|nr:nucleotide-binding protein [Saprospiraceae bacterium]MBK6858924.1 nucleotide-binding protein [Saprospiraceae bacterium]MBK8298271.1 nucleotide-binding protein [Saprospiraceae bacterium]
MELKLILETIIKNGYVAYNDPSSVRTKFEKWFSYAENSLKQVFGDNWTDIVPWEGYIHDTDYFDAKSRLLRALRTLENSLHLFPTEITLEQEKSIRHAKEYQVFIVHGHDEIAKLDLKNYLQNTLNLPEPIILHEKPNFGKAIIEKFEEYASKATIAFILLTPDDYVSDGKEDNINKYRARQNVILELGYFLGIFGRKSGNVILLHKGNLDIPSDISGIVYIDISNGVESAGEKIRRELFK